MIKNRDLCFVLVGFILGMIAVLQPFERTLVHLRDISLNVIAFALGLFIFRVLLKPVLKQLFK